MPHISRCPTGFFVCKLKKISNRKKGGSSGDDLDGGVDGFEPAEDKRADGVGQDAEKLSRDRNVGVQKKERNKQDAMGHQAEQHKDRVDDVGEGALVKKKRIRGIVKKAQAELLAEREAKKQQQQQHKKKKTNKYETKTTSENKGKSEKAPAQDEGKSATKKKKKKKTQHTPNNEKMRSR